MEKIKLLLYCTESNKKLFFDVVSQKYMFGLNGKNDKFNSLNGKIVAECDFYTSKIWYGVNEKNEYINFMAVCDDACLTIDEIDTYLKGQNGYAIHIKNLNIFDKPRELQNYVKKAKNGTYWMLDKAPQNMMACYKQNKEKYILISIRPEWLCKILNGEKTIEVRKKVLKEMITDA